MRGEMRMIPALASLAAGCADQPSGAARGNRYREVNPGVCQLGTTVTPASAPKTHTREKLMRKCGFKR